jgi:azurin
MSGSIPSPTLKSAFSSLILGSALVFAACGKKEEKQAESAPQTPAAEAPGAQAAPIVITANDQMQFSTKAIEAAAGSEVTVILQNIGTMPKENMGHNFTLLKAGTVVADFATKAMAAKATDYIPAGDTAVIAHTKLLGPGESDTLKFTAPPAGEYPYVCTFPGHFAVMQGILTTK